MEHVRIQIHGIVQGVGFRPFIHRLVGEFGLNGTVKNTSSGVELELEGERETLEAFLARNAITRAQYDRGLREMSAVLGSLS